MRAVRSGVYNIHFGPARPGLFSSQTYKSLGGESVTGRVNCTYCTPGFGPQSLHTITLLLSRALASLVHRHSVQVAGRIRPGVLCAATRVEYE